MSKRQRTDLIVIHCTAGNSTDTVASIRNYHVKKKKWRDIGYNRLVDGKGKRHNGRGWDETGAHVGGYNSRSVGIAWIGGVDGKGPSAAQFAGLKAEVKEALRRYPDAKVCGHRDLSPDGDRDGTVEPHEWTKTCPLFNAEVWAAENGFPHTNFSGAVSGVVRTKPPIEGPDTREMWLQKLLRQEGANIHADGIVGDLTGTAIEVFQTDHGLAVNGKFDTPTVALLRKRSEAREAVNTVTVEKVVEVVKPAPTPATTPVLVPAGIASLVTAIAALIARHFGV